ncbi:hypothetical protein E3O55_18980 [Cryobacterium sp. MDB1-18-2]|uniref:hypothetical protein n=1 Tax=unclassified Cryobacterium TaxID=2649013 RepID=UPI0010697E17|nr:MULTISPECIES: hypothetical protein [unclassified Cryobacterium]TFC22103.1 hypothetical protein E3O55_18980 [Cryobacterium sp. MDB1-18-2]TFC40676.1 hypothetical protein E3O50_12775 [Cryobacterium sp. MDB1-18-1]
MLTVESVFLQEVPLANVNESAPNVLELDDELFETCFAGMKFDAVHLRWGLLFDLRTSLNFVGTGSNTGLLVLDGVTKLTWSASLFPSETRAWIVMGSRVEGDSPGVSIEIGFTGATEYLAVEATRGAFYALTLTGLGRIQPDFVDESDANVIAGMPAWDRECELQSVTVSRNGW